jgi:presenilin-like A22 family membrane protease
MLKMQIEEEKIEQPTFNPKRVLFWEAFLFILILVLGAISSLRASKFLKIKESQKVSLEPLSFLKLTLSILLAALAIFLIIKFVKFRPGKEIFFRTIFILAMGFGGLVFFEIWFGEPSALILISILVIFWLKQQSILLHNLLLIIGIIGAGSFLGLGLDPLVVIVLLIIFSIYDIIAVYKTKHMIKMAKEFIEAKAIPGLILPQKISEVSAPLKDVKMGGRFLVLGSGDIIFPLLLVSSLVPEGIKKSFLVAIFATIGLLTSIGIFLFQKTRKPIPALPPIALFSIIGYLLTLIIR